MSPTITGSINARRRQTVQNQRELC
jgi:hypothetical protein